MSDENIVARVVIVSTVLAAIISATVNRKKMKAEVESFIQYFLVLAGAMLMLLGGIVQYIKADKGTITWWHTYDLEQFFCFRVPSAILGVYGAVLLAASLSSLRTPSYFRSQKFNKLLDFMLIAFIGSYIMILNDSIAIPMLVGSILFLVYTILFLRKVE